MHSGLVSKVERLKILIPHEPKNSVKIDVSGGPVKRYNGFCCIAGCIFSKAVPLIETVDEYHILISTAPSWTAHSLLAHESGLKTILTQDLLYSSP